MGNLYTTTDGAILTGLTAGELILDFVYGTITKPDGTTAEMKYSIHGL